MARGFPFTTAGLMALIALVLFHESCSSEDNQHCPPSSCGNIHNISYPFRLRTDPITCGDLSYNLSCENNHTVLYLFEGKYDVQTINYNNYTIRIVDSGIQKQNYTPAYSLNHYNFSFGTDGLGSAYSTIQLKRTVVFRRILGYPLTRSVVFMSCENPVNSPFYLDTSTCIDNGEDSSNTSISHSKRYNRYAIAGTTKEKDVEDSCKVDQTTFLTPWPGFDPIISCNKLVYGFEPHGSKVILIIIAEKRAMVATSMTRTKFIAFLKVTNADVILLFFNAGLLRYILNYILSYVRNLFDVEGEVYISNNFY
ncbi:rust resistance kinase Lr10-like isoform X2 [Fagus crenata]